MPFEMIKFEVRDDIAEITLNRPHRLNAVVQQLYDEFQLALNDIDKSRSIRALLITGEGRAFCVGADLKEHKAGRTAFDRRTYLKGEQDVCRRIVELTKPVIAAVNGYALGAGAEIAIASDFVVMAEKAQIGFPEIGLGNFLGGGVTVFLPKLVGLAKARELVFFGEHIDGREAHRIGLATRVFPDKEFIEHARRFAREIALKAPISMELAKMMLNRAQDMTLDAALIAELEGMMFCSTTRDWQEGVDAFSERRTPVFKGE